MFLKENELVLAAKCNKALDPKDPRAYNAVQVSVSYSKGGTNYFTGGQNLSGIHIYVSPIKVKDGEGYGSFSTMLGDGLKALMEPAQRLNRKRVAKVFEEVKIQLAAKSGTPYDVVRSILQKFGLELVEPSTAPQV